MLENLIVRRRVRAVAANNVEHCSDRRPVPHAARVSIQAPAELFAYVIHRLRECCLSTPGGCATPVSEATRSTTSNPVIDPADGDGWKRAQGAQCYNVRLLPGQLRPLVPHMERPLWRHLALLPSSARFCEDGIAALLDERRCFAPCGAKPPVRGGPEPAGPDGLGGHPPQAPGHRRLAEHGIPGLLDQEGAAGHRPTALPPC